MGTTGAFVDVLQGHSTHAEYRRNRTVGDGHHQDYIEVPGEARTLEDPPDHVLPPCSRRERKTSSEDFHAEVIIPRYSIVSSRHVFAYGPVDSERCAFAGGDKLELHHKFKADGN